MAEDPGLMKFAFYQQALGGSGSDRARIEFEFFRRLFESGITISDAGVLDFGVNLIGWASVDKTGSSLADLATRSASDLNSGTLPNARLSAVPYSALSLTGAIVNADISGSAAIERAKLDFGSGLVNADIAAAAAIAYSKLNLATSIVNADINAAAAIALSKLAGWPANSTGFLKNDGAGALSWQNANTKPYLQWTASQVSPLGSGYATPDTRNNRPCLDFDGSTDEEAVFDGVLPAAYAGGGLTCELWVAFTSATSGDSRWQAAIERMASLDLDSDNFTSFQSAGGTAPGTSGELVQVTITFTDGSQIGSLAAGEPFRLKIRRDADGTSGTDDIATDAELFRVVLRET